MEPILLIHGYSAESDETSKKAIAGIYGDLPAVLRATYGDNSVFELDLSRYVSLEDGVTIDDISRGMDRVLRNEFSHLLTRPFHVVVHSTGALVVRNWIRRFSPKPSPIRNLVYLAGANFGSGWAHIGKGQLAKWSRLVFQGGTERGVLVLDALELGSDWTLDLHRHFLEASNTMYGAYKVSEYVVIGTQADAAWYTAPIRYGKEDGSDGVVRVAASNLNFNYVRFGPTQEAYDLSWPSVSGERKRNLDRKGKRGSFYEIKETSRPGVNGRPEVPFAIPYQCAHSGDKMGIVTGSAPRKQVLKLLKTALETSPGDWSRRVDDFAQETAWTYDQALTGQAAAGVKKWIAEPRAQYDHHAQLIFRIRDQNGRPVKHYDIFLDSVQGARDPSKPIGELFEDKHVNDLNPNIITFFLRTDAFSKEKNAWVSRLEAVGSCFVEVSAVEPETEEILYLPMRFEFDASVVKEWIQGDRTTVVDVELLRLPSPEVFRIVNY